MTDKFKKLDIGLGCILTCLYFIALPLTISTNSAGNSFLKILTIPIAGYLAVSLIFYKGKIEFNIVHFFSALYLISVVTTLFVDNSSTSVMYVRGYIETIALLFLMTVKEYSKNEIEAFEVTQLILLVILICLGFSGADWYGDRNTMTLFGATCDPNYFSGLFLLPITVALKKLKESKIYMAVCPVLIALGAYIVLSSGSRGGLLALAVTVASFVFLNTKSAKQRLIGFGAAIIVAVIMWTVIIPLLPDSVSQRFSVAAVIESRGTSRVDIWISMLDAIKHSTWELFCGRGVNSYHEMMIEGKLVHVVAHNQFIQSLYNQGLFGFISFVLMSASAIFRNIKKRGYISAAMLGTLALTMSLSINPSIKGFWNLLIYSAFTLNITNKQKEVDSI
ncbi:MAG: O-antigen ligase family protein [Monoglobaceae bacterium]